MASACFFDAAGIWGQKPVRKISFRRSFSLRERICMEYVQANGGRHALCGCLQKEGGVVTGAAKNAYQRGKRRHRRPPGTACIAWITRLPACRVLACLYLLFSFIRILSALMTTTTPVVMPDSALYMQLSRSIFEKGRLLFRGQPIRYEYILYPLLLSPLHLLPEGVSFFRAAQVLNVLLMHLSIFPVYALARSITKSSAHSLLAVLLTLLMPDFQITRHIMAESAAFPLVLTACYVYYQAAGKQQPRFFAAVLCGGLGALLYAIKPGCAALPACFFLVMLQRALRDHDKRKLRLTLTGTFTLCILLLLYMLLLRFGLQISMTQSTLYGSQTHPLTGEHILQALEGLALYGAYLPLAFCFFPLFFPAAHAKALDNGGRQLLYTVLLAIGMIVAGTVYVIYGDERMQGNAANAARVHARYVSAFLPVLLACLLSPALAGKKLNAKHMILLSLPLLLFLCFSGWTLKSGKAYPADALLLTALALDQPAFPARAVWIVMAFACLACICTSIARHGFCRGPRRAVCAFLAASFLLNGGLSFFLYRHHQDSVYPQDARQAVQLAGTKNTLGVVRDGGCFWPEAGELDTASRCALPVVELDDLIKNARADGSLTAFTPKAYWQENAQNQIQAPEKLILTNELLSSLVLAEDARNNAAVTANGGYCVVPLRPGQPALHSALSGLNEGWVQGGGRFTLFDTALRGKGRITLWLRARSGEGTAALALCSGGQTQSFPLSDSLQWISASFAAGDPGQALTVELLSAGGNIFVETYQVE